MMPDSDGSESPSSTTPTKSADRRPAAPDSDGDSSTSNQSSTSKRPKIDKEKESSPPKSGALPISHRTEASFPPPSNTTDSVRLKCREMLCTAIKGDEGKLDFGSTAMVELI